MSICIYQVHKPTGYKKHELHQPVQGTPFNEMSVYERLIQTLEACGIGPDQHPIDLIDMAKYESESWIIQVIIFEGQLETL